MLKVFLLFKLLFLLPKPEEYNGKINKKIRSNKMEKIENELLNTEKECFIDG